MRFLVLALLCLIAVIAYVQRTGINAVKELVSGTVGIDTEDFGVLGSALLAGYALMQVPAGWLADRLGARNVLVILALSWSILTGAIGLCPDFTTMLVLWFTMGMALAGIFPCAAKAIGAWFPDTEKAMASGLLGSATMLGAAAGAWLTGWLVFREGFSWQFFYALYGGAGVLWALAYMVSVPERGGRLSTAPPMTRSDWQRLFASVPLWLLFGQQFFRGGAMIFFINWFPPFLREARGITQYDAAAFASYVGIAAMAGGILGGFFSDWLLRMTGMRRLSRQGVAVAGMTGAAVLVLSTRSISDDVVAVVVFGVAAFIATFGGVSGYTVTIEYGGTRIGTVFSIMNMGGNVGAALVNAALGSIVQRTGSWDAALLAVAGIFAVDTVCWALLNPRRPLFEEHHERPC